MNEEITKRLLEYLDGTKDFLLEQSPQVLKEMMRYKTISAILNIFLCFSIICVCLGVFLYCFKSSDRSKYGDREFWQIAGMFTPIFVGAVLFVQLCCNIDELIKIKVAPKYYIIKELLNK